MALSHETYYDQSQAMVIAYDGELKAYRPTNDNFDVAFEHIIMGASYRSALHIIDHFDCIS